MTWQREIPTSGAVGRDFVRAQSVRIGEKLRIVAGPTSAISDAQYRRLTVLTGNLLKTLNHGKLCHFLWNYVD